MKNAHLRMGSLQFTKTLRDTTIDITLRMDRMIAEHDADNRSARCHLLSVIGNDQEVAAIAAAIADEARFYASGPDVHRLMITLGNEAEVFRSSMSIPGRRRPLRHLVAISEELSKTRAGGNPTARRTILCDDDRASCFTGSARDLACRFYRSGASGSGNCWNTRMRLNR